MSEYLDILQSDEAEWVQELWKPKTGDTVFLRGPKIVIHLERLQTKDKRNLKYPYCVWKPTLEQLLDLWDASVLAKHLIVKHTHKFDSDELCAVVLKAVIAQQVNNLL